MADDIQKQLVVFTESVKKIEALLAYERQRADHAVTLLDHATGMLDSEKRATELAEKQRDEAWSEIDRLRVILAEAANERDVCVLCGADTRLRYDCKSCPIDHMGGDCLRRGEHNSSCPLKEFESPHETDARKFRPDRVIVQKDGE